MSDAPAPEEQRYRPEDGCPLFSERLEEHLVAVQKGREPNRGVFCGHCSSSNDVLASYISGRKRAGVSNYIVKPFNAATLKTKIEAVFPDSDYNYWMGLLVPSKTPKDIVERLRAETEKALKHPNVVEKFKPQGIEPMPLSPAEFDALIAKEIGTNIGLVKAAGLTFK